MQQVPFSMVIQQQQPQDVKQPASQSVNSSYYRQYQQILSSFEQVQQKIIPIDKSSKNLENTEPQQLKSQIKGVLTSLTAKINEIIVFQQRLAKIVNDGELMKIIPQIDQLNKLQTRVQSLQTQLQLEQQQSQYYQIQSAELSQKYEVTKRELNHRSVQHGTIEKMADRQIASLKRTIQQLEVTIKHLKDEKADAIAAQERMSNQLGKFQVEMTEKQAEFNQQISVYKERLYQLQNDSKEQLLQQNKQHQANISGQKAENERLQERLIQLQAQYGETKAEIKTQRDRLAIISAERDNYFQKLKDQRRRTADKVAQMEQRLDDLKTKNEELEQKLDEKENAAAGLRAEFGGSSRTELAHALRQAEAAAAQERLRADHLKKELLVATELRESARCAAQQARLEAEQVKNLAKERQEQEIWASSSATRQEASNLITSLKQEVKILRDQLDSAQLEVDRLRGLTSPTRQSRLNSRATNNSIRAYFSTNMSNSMLIQSSSSPNSRFASMQALRNNIQSRPSQCQRPQGIYLKQSIDCKQSEQQQDLAQNDLTVRQGSNINQISLSNREKYQDNNVNDNSFDVEENNSNSFDDFDNADNNEHQSRSNVSQSLKILAQDVNNSPSKQDRFYTDNMFDNYTALNFVDDPDSPSVFLEANRANIVQSKHSNVWQSMSSNAIPKAQIKVQNTKSKDAKFIGSIPAKNVSPARPIQVNQKAKKSETAQEREKKIKEIVFQPPLKNS